MIADRPVNTASLFNLAGPDLFVILIIVLLLFGAKKPRKEFERQEEESWLATLDRLLVPIAIAILLLACGVWVFGRNR